jgi:hypothetical protein
MFLEFSFTYFGPDGPRVVQIDRARTAYSIGGRAGDEVVVDAHADRVIVEDPEPDLGLG